MQNALKRGNFATFEHVFSLEGGVAEMAFCKILIPYLTK